MGTSGSKCCVPKRQKRPNSPAAVPPQKSPIKDKEECKSSPKREGHCPNSQNQSIKNQSFVSVVSEGRTSKSRYLLIHDQNGEIRKLPLKPEMQLFEVKTYIREMTGLNDFKFMLTQNGNELTDDSAFVHELSFDHKKSIHIENIPDYQMPIVNPIDIKTDILYDHKQGKSRNQRNWEKALHSSKIDETNDEIRKEKMFISNFYNGFEESLLDKREEFTIGTDLSLDVSDHKIIQSGLYVEEMNLQESHIVHDQDDNHILHRNASAEEERKQKSTGHHYFGKDGFGTSSLRFKGDRSQMVDLFIHTEEGEGLEDKEEEQGDSFEASLGVESSERGPQDKAPRASALWMTAKPKVTKSNNSHRRSEILFEEQGGDEGETEEDDTIDGSIDDSKLKMRFSNFHQNDLLLRQFSPNTTGDHSDSSFYLSEAPRLATFGFHLNIHNSHPVTTESTSDKIQTAKTNPTHTTTTTKLHNHIQSKPDSTDKDSESPRKEKFVVSKHFQYMFPNIETEESGIVDSDQSVNNGIDGLEGRYSNDNHPKNLFKDVHGPFFAFG